MEIVSQLTRDLTPSADRLSALAITYGGRLLGALLIFLVFFFAARLADSMLTRIGERDRTRVDLYDVLAGGARISILVFGALTALGTLGVDITALVAGLGLTGLALGLALKDTVSNFVSGIMLITYRPFLRGDRVDIGGAEGLVTKLDLRYTTLERDGVRFLIPNQNILNSTVRIIPPGSSATASVVFDTPGGGEEVGDDA